MATFKNNYTIKTTSTFIQNKNLKNFTSKEKDVSGCKVYTSKYKCFCKMINHHSPKLQFFNKTTLTLLFILSSFTATHTSRPTPLYGEKDAVISVDRENFKQVLTSSSSLIALEFYSSWCGHCQRFAPKWKRLAIEIQDWSPFIRLAAINCVDEINSAICSTYDINAYPTFMLFKANLNEVPTINDTYSLDYSDDDFVLKTSMVHSLNEEGNGLSSELQNYLDPTSESSLKTDKEKNVLIEEGIDSTIGTMLKLDFYTSRDRLSINRVVKDGIRPHFASIYFITKAGTPAKLLNSRFYEEHKEVVFKVLGDQPIPKWTDEVAESGSTSLKPLVFTPLNWNHSSYISLSSQDLTTALQYMLKVEVPNSINKKPRNYIILQQLVALFAKHLPVDAKISSELHKLHAWLTININKYNTNNDDRITTGKWLRAVKTTMKSFRKFPQEYVSCKGSSGKYRGYPCGLWTSFHAVTVNCADQSKDDGECVNAMQSIRDYVLNFFGCRECAENFKKETISYEDPSSNNPLKIPSNRSQTVLVLWRVHNNANKRLKGDLTEDPAHPKTLFPNKFQCPQCHNEQSVTSHTSITGIYDEWNEEKVLEYLNRMYLRKNVYITSKKDLLLKSSLGIYNYDLVNKNDSSINSSGVLSILNVFALFSSSSTPLVERKDIFLFIAFYSLCTMLLVFAYVKIIKKRVKKCYTKEFV